MKTNTILFIIGAVLQGVTIAAHAQIRDNDSSSNLLSVQCSVSSGHAADGFEEYSRKLAKTLALLSPVQQTRVFGYLPQPVTSDSGGGVTTQASSVGGETVLPAAAPGNLDGLVGLVGDFNTALSGSESEISPVYGGVSPDAEAGEPNRGSQITELKTENASTGNGSGAAKTPSSWDALIARFLAAAEDTLAKFK